MRFILPFLQITKKDIAIAGGKGASLGEMTKAGFPIPPGFVILASAFDSFLEQTDLNVEVESELKKADPKKTHTIDDASEVLRSLIGKYPMPQGIEKKIAIAFNKLKARYVAVRSSATAEDSRVASWAGELESYLGVQKKELMDAVKKCWSSLFTPRAIFYRIEKKINGKKVSVAVVIQKMVESEVAGVCFTVHPVTGDRNQMVIEASWGLGEAVVGGKVTPDCYVVDKQKMKIIDITVNEQLIEIKRIGEKTKEIKVSLSRASKQCLPLPKIIALAQICKKIEAHYGFPCDIEWAVEKDKIYIVQSRPITTL
ncbi:MAG: PEP/pyruvate-binding domain-containing protein [Patescibacteria group bacterium]|nr:PEP/pyruvate-binding domain-containing protein [Patescibacteria group bacterium]